VNELPDQTFSKFKKEIRRGKIQKMQRLAFSGGARFGFAKTGGVARSAQPTRFASEV